MIALIQPRSAGDIAINGVPIERFDPALHALGIVPQYNVLWDTLTVNEHFQVVGQLKGLNESRLRLQRELFSQVLNFQAFGDRKAQFLSGGNKRKLQTVVAMLGNAHILLLDEPSAGMDPISRKRLYSHWRAMTNQSLILITQRIEEAEIICDNIALMANGQFQDFGPPAQLKQKHGKGYQLKLELCHL